MYKSSIQTEPHRTHRSGAVVLELILTAPAFLMIMLAIIQISLVYTVIEQTAYASRYAAKIASETASGSLSTIVSNGNLKGAVDRVLRTGGLSQGSCRVILEENAPSGGTEQTYVAPTSSCDCDPPASSLPSVANSTENASVRTTVCVRLGGNVPDFLKTFGFSIEDFLVVESTTFLYEYEP